MRGRLNSDLPRGAGLSSSAALEVVIGMALAAIAELELEPLALAALARRAEHRAVGVPSGIMDQAASVLGRAGSAVFLDCGTLEHHLVPLPSDYALLVIDSGVRRELESSAYAERTRELARALPALRGRRPADVDPSELDVLLRDLEPVPARRLRHVITENARVRLAERAFLAGDLVGLGDLFAAGHASLRDNFEVTVPELDSLVGLAREAGAVAARMTGGGFGGSIVAVVATSQAEDAAAEVLHRYAGAHPGRAGRAYVCRAADGARELTPGGANRPK
jgi:galactokinase